MKKKKKKQNLRALPYIDMVWRTMSQNETH